MIRFLKIPLILFVFILLPNNGSSSTSSSYLIANAAISSFDYETAVKYFDNDDYDDFSIRALRKKIVSYINSNKLEEAKVIANQVIKLDENSEDVWLVLLTFATLNNDLKIFNNFERLSNKNEFKIIDYVFYDNGQLKNNNEDVAERLFDLAQAKDSSNLYYPENID